MGQLLQAFKDETRALVGRRREPEQPTAQPYYDDVRPPAQPYGGQAYGQPPATIDPAVLQALLQGAKAQGAYEALQNANDASADRMQALALAAINKENKPFEIRYRGSAYDKRQRVSGQLKFALFCVLLVLALIAIWSVKDSWNPSPGWSAGAPMSHANRPAHYKHTEEWDDR